MKKILTASILAGILILCLVPLALAQGPTPAAVPTVVTGGVPNLDARRITDALGQPEFRMVLLLAIVFGGLGGLVYELVILQGSVENPHKVDGAFTYDLGVWGRILMGSLAAIATLYVFSPEDAYKLIAVSVAAGASGSAVFKSLQSRLEAVISQHSLNTTHELIAEMGDRAAEATRALTRGGRAPSGQGVQFTDDQQHALQLLSEIQALSIAGRRPAPTRRGPQSPVSTR